MKVQCPFSNSRGCNTLYGGTGCPHNGIHDKSSSCAPYLCPIAKQVITCERVEEK